MITTILGIIALFIVLPIVCLLAVSYGLAFIFVYADLVIGAIAVWIIFKILERRRNRKH